MIEEGQFYNFTTIYNTKVCNLVFDLNNFNSNSIIRLSICY